MLKQNQTIILICLLLLLVLIIFILYFKNKQKKSKENYQGFAAAASAQKVKTIVALINKAYDAYQFINSKIPQILEIYKTLTNWNILKPKICEWASQNKLITGLLHVIEQVQMKKKLSQKATKILNSLKSYLLKLQLGIAVVKQVKSVTDLIPSDVLSSVKSKLDTLSNLDKSIGDLLIKVPGFGGC